MERFKQLGSEEALKTAGATLLQSSKAKDEALAALMRQLSDVSLREESANREMAKLKDDFNRQVEAARGSLVQALASSLADASSEMEKQFGAVDLDLTLQRLLTHLRVLGVSRLHLPGEIVKFQKDRHVSRSGLAAENDDVEVFNSGYVQLVGQSTKVLIKAEVE
jgi:molecular chaperone GrpE (heat shock protein)